MRWITLVLAVIAIAWCVPFVRGAWVTLRTGKPFVASGGHAGGWFGNAQFGRVGAVVVTLVVLFITAAIVYWPIHYWCAAGAPRPDDLQSNSVPRSPTPQH